MDSKPATPQLAPWERMLCAVEKLVDSQCELMKGQCERDKAIAEAARAWARTEELRAQAVADGLSRLDADGPRLAPRPHPAFPSSSIPSEASAYYNNYQNGGDYSLDQQSKVALSEKRIREDLDSIAREARAPFSEFFKDSPQERP